jgi:hypothetical protein
MSLAFEPISLGYSCEVKYQLSRTLFRRKYPDGAEEDLRRMLMTPDYGQRSFERHIFDWQITPFAAVLEYLERDFEGVFEREDLHVEDGAVAHRRLKTRHPHDFHPYGGRLDEAAIDRGYAAARSKFDYLAGKFLAHLARPGLFLYVVKEIRIYDEAVRLSDLLRRRNPDHAFKLLFVGFEGEDQMLEGLRGEVFKAWVPAAPDKPADRAWEGDDGRWDQILRDWTFSDRAAERITRTFDESLAGADAPPAVPRGSFRRWLSQRLGT